MSTDDDERGRRRREVEKPVPTGGLKRLWRTGRSAVQLASTVLGRRDGAVNLPGMEQLAERLGELKGVGMKVGQILSFIDPSLPPEVRRALSVLQRNAPASSFEAVRRVLKQAFGSRSETLLATLERQPFSVASIGQVHRAELDGRRVVVKVRHPGIEQAIAADFSAARGGLGFANTLLFGMASGARDLVEETRSTLLSECDFAREAAHQRSFRTAGRPARCSPRSRKTGSPSKSSSRGPHPANATPRGRRCSA
jgi:predicted unusual protein kinase regulating ubiquinone biosynthesis (AarF/ABC1/UbiB family)